MDRYRGAMDLARRKLSFYAPILIVIVIASILVYCSILSSITTTATVVQPANNGNSGQQAWAGLLNALIFFIPALVGGLFIFLLFKYRKRGLLRILFGVAMFLIGTMATGYFGFLFIVMLMNIGVRVYPVTVELGGIPVGPMGTNPVNLVSVTIVSMVLGVLMSYLLFSRGTGKKEKNIALLYMGALMGAFLSTLIPTWALAIFMVLLSFYDLYAVKRGPIKKIVEMTMADEVELDRQRYLEREEARLRAMSPAKLSHDEEGGWGLGPGKGGTRKGLLTRLMNGGDTNGRLSEADMIMNSMTYSGGNWDLGIGDLVFYSVLSSHALMLGIGFIDDFGILAPVLFFAAAVTGILIGFRYTIRKLEENIMLPGLPIPILLSMTLVAFVYTVLIFIYP